MKIHKNTLRIISIFVLIAIASFVVSSQPNLNGNAILTDSANSGEVQIVKLSVSGGSYILSPSTITKGIPVRIEADMSKMPGCSKSIVIPSFNVRKTLTSKDNVIEFTPDKSGTFNIACSMNMYRGTFKVLDEAGKESNYVEEVSTAGATCGSGGCGCGG